MIWIPVFLPTGRQGAGMTKLDMTYNIITIGCQMNVADSERLRFYLEKLGFKNEPDFLLAKLVVFVTCGVKQAAEDRIHGLINRIYKNNKKTVIVVTGCLSDRDDLHKSLKGRVKIWFNISDLLNFDKKLKNFFPKIKTIRKKEKDYLELEADYSSSFSAFVPIGNGCNNFCSYCVVPYARGREVYRPAYDILKEVQKLIKKGYKEISLIAQNVNSYKSDSDNRIEKEFGFKLKNKKIDFADLLLMVDKLEGDFWLRFSSSHPKDVSNKLITVLKKTKHLCEHFHLAVQSGDNHILEAMNRRYTIETYKERVKKIRESLDFKNGFSASITSDVIVGFPGEKIKNFNNTKKLFKEISFDLVYISKYSPRYKTASSYLKDDVSLSEKKRRERELNIILRKTALKNNQQYLNKVVDILIEGFDRKGFLTGRTRTSKLVRISHKVACPNDFIGKFVKVEITNVFEFELQAKIVGYDFSCLSIPKYSKDKKKKISQKKGKVVVVLGPTASGKTSLAVRLADKFNGEIVSADSRQVYRGMDIGTGKDLAEYYFEDKKINHHLIDIVNPQEIFNLADYQKQAFLAIDDIIGRGKLPFLVGGSGLYLEAVVDNYLLSESKPSFEKRDEFESLEISELQKRIKSINKKFFLSLNNSDLNNKRRLARYLEVLLNEKSFEAKRGKRKYDFLILGLNPERAVVKEKIYKRLLDRINNEDMIGEVKRLHKSGVSYERLESFGLEYRFISLFLQNKISEQQLIDRLFVAICQFSKRQMSWFRRWEKNGAEIVWLENKNDVVKFIKSFLG